MVVLLIFYRRSEDEPKKKFHQIKKLIENPPNMKKYQNFIRKALLALTFQRYSNSNYRFK